MRETSFSVSWKLLVGAVVTFCAIGVWAAGAEPMPPTGGAATTSASNAKTQASGATPKLVTLPSGLKYIDLVVGTGAEVKKGMRALVDYESWLADGTKFDSSLDRREPFAFTTGAGQVIAGWDEGVLGMRVGGKRKLVIPPELAYGAEGAPPRIPPNATLTFEVKILTVK